MMFFSNCFLMVGKLAFYFGKRQKVLWAPSGFCAVRGLTDGDGVSVKYPRVFWRFYWESKRRD